MEFGMIPSMSDPTVGETTPSPGEATPIGIVSNYSSAMGCIFTYICMCAGIDNVLEVIIPSLKQFHSLLTRKPEVHTGGGVKLLWGVKAPYEGRQTCCVCACNQWTIVP